MKSQLFRRLGGDDSGADGGLQSAAQGLQLVIAQTHGEINNDDGAGVDRTSL